MRSLKFEGNNAFSGDELSTRVAITPSSFAHRWFGWFFNAGAKRCFPDVGLAGDVASLKQFYLNNGFRDTKVDTVVAPANASGSSLRVAFRIDEGLPILIDTLTVTGLEGVADTARILRNLRMHVGGRFGLELLIADEDSITRRMTNSGYPHAAVLPSYTVNRAEHRATVGLEVNAGALSHFGTISVAATSVHNTQPEIDSVGRCSACSVFGAGTGMATARWSTRRATSTTSARTGTWGSSSTPRSSTGTVCPT